MATSLQSSSAVFDAALTRVEQALALVGGHLAQGRANDLEAACQTLQAAMLACSRIDPQWLKTLSADRKLQSRLQLIRLGIVQVRESMARRAAGVQRALQILLPTGAVATYGRAASAFGSGTKSAASFTSLSA